MLYLPYQVFSLREQLAAGVVQASELALQDFIAGENKPWAYYAGAATGYMAAATGITGAAATLYAIGNTINTGLFHSPDGSLATFYVNGILAAEIDTYTDQVLGEWLSFALNITPGILNRIDIVNANNPNVNKSSLVNWLALGPVETQSDTTIQLKGNNMITLAIRLQDAEQNSPYATIPIYLPDGLTAAQVQTYADAIIPEIDALTESQVVEANVTFALTLPGGIKANPEDGAFNERGGLVTFDTTGPRAASVRIPAIDKDVMPGDSFALTAPAVAALVTRLTTSTTAENVRPVTEQDYLYSAARAGKKSLRR